MLCQQPALSTAVPVVPLRQSHLWTRRTLWPSSHPCHLSCSITPQPVTSAHSEGLHQCPIKPHTPTVTSTPLPPAALWDPFVLLRGNQQAHAGYGAPHNLPSPRSLRVPRTPGGRQDGWQGAGREPRAKQGSAPQCSHALGNTGQAPGSGRWFYPSQNKARFSHSQSGLFCPALRNLCASAPRGAGRGPWH